MEQVTKGLYATRPEPLPVGRSTTLRAFLCRRQAGNVLVYGSPAVPAEAQAIADLGGAWRHYLGHGHESEFVTEPPAAEAVLIHERDSAELARRVGRVETFSADHLVGDDFEVIPIPGHTPGTTAYVWDSGHERVLFSADTIFLRDGEWQVALLSSSDRDAYVESLERIRELEFDLLAPWIAGAGQVYWTRTNRADRHRRVDAILRQIEGG